MSGKIVCHWQHGVGLLISHDGELGTVLFEKDNRERVLALANLTDEAGKPLVQKPASEVIGRVRKTKRECNMDVLYEHIRQAGKPVFTDYPSCPQLMQELNSKGGTFGSAGTLSGYASALHKQGLIDFAEGCRGSGWVPAQRMES